MTTPAIQIMVISTSFGGGKYSSRVAADNAYPAMTSAANMAVAAGITILASSGNEAYTDGLSWPSAMSNVISVGAVYDAAIGTAAFAICMDTQTAADKVTCYSNTASILDILAPSHNAYTSDISGNAGYTTGDYSPDFGGTSAACPYAAGAVACLQSAAKAKTGSYFTPSEIRAKLASTGVPITDTKVAITKPRVNLGSAVNSIADIAAPLPNPAQWSIEPKATGLHTIAMEAVTATDTSGVQYLFDCVTDHNFSGTWQDSVTYIKTNLALGTTYTFRVKARDKSTNQNQTGWSTSLSATTAAAVDNLSPAPDPARWDKKPKKLSSPTRIQMKAKTASDESGVQYSFRCVNTTKPGIDPSTLNSNPVWQSSATYTVSTNVADNYSYTFQCKAKDGLGNETAWSDMATVTLGTSGSGNVLSVPSPYSTIRYALSVASSGDIIEVKPGVYYEGDLDFGGNAVLLRSVDPGNSSVVASTIIDVPATGSGLASGSHRAFIFQTGEGRNSIIDGFTIRNGYVYVNGFDGVGAGVSGTNGMDALGGAIYCTGSSPTIRRCVITDCIARGGDGGDGVNGSNTGTDPMPDGGWGGQGGGAFGGAICVDGGGSPLIESTTIIDCCAISGAGGNGANGTNATATIQAGAGGRGGDSGAVWGGAIYCGPASNIDINNCSISDNLAWAKYAPGQGGNGGNDNTTFPGDGPDGSNGGGYPGYGGGISLSFATIANSTFTNNTVFAAMPNQSMYFISGGFGGGIYCDESANVISADTTISGNLTIGDGGGFYAAHDGIITLTRCDITGNTALSADNGAYPGNGGGIFAGDILNPLSTTVNITDCNISVNTAYGQGGGMYAEEVVLTMDTSFVNNNVGKHGNGIYGFNCQADVNNCLFKNNTSLEEACSGGACSWYNTAITMRNSLITGNNASGSGGALFFDGHNSPQKVVNCLITDNTAYIDGGGISSNIGATVTLSNCTIVNNTVTGAFGSGGGVSSAERWAYVAIESSILWNNTVAGSAYVSGSQIAVGTPLGSDPYDGGPYADVDVMYSDVQGGEEGVYLEDEPNTEIWWNNGNIAENPLFVSPDVNEPAYYLSQIAAGQLIDSNCVNGGDPASAFDFTNYTTRTDFVADTNIVDMGYHYKAAAAIPKYTLKISVIGDASGGSLIAQAGGSDAFSITAPATRLVNQGTTVKLVAQPNPGYFVTAWSGTDNDTIMDVNNNTATMNRNRTVTVDFHKARMIFVPAQYPDIEAAITAAKNKDTIVVSPKSDGTPYVVSDRDGFDFKGKHVTLISDRRYPSVVIDCQGSKASPRRAFQFHSGEGMDTVVSGFTIQNGFMTGPRGLNGVVPQPGDPCDPNIVSAFGGEDVFGDGYGGAIYINDSSPTIEYCKFINCAVAGAVGGDGANGADQYNSKKEGQAGGPGGTGTGNGYGGAIYVNPNSNPVIRYCVFSGNFAHGGLGGDGGNGGNSSGSSVLAGSGGDGGNGEGFGYGAAIYIADGVKTTILDCNMEQGTASGGVGGLGGNVGSGSLIESNKQVVFTGFDGYNLGVGYAGAVFSGKNSEPNFVNCLILQNRSRGWDWQKNTFSAGGALYCDVNSLVTIKNCEFNGNFIGDTYEELTAGLVNVVSGPGNGGALYCADDVNINVTDSHFIGNNNNSALIYYETGGGGLPNREGYNDGGAIYFKAGGAAKITNCNISGNSAYLNGGGIYHKAKPVTIKNTAISGNKAIYGDGGGFYSYDPNTTAALTLTDCTISKNTANINGGGVFWRNFDAVVTNCYFISNQAQVPADFILSIALRHPI